MREGTHSTPYRPLRRFSGMVLFEICVFAFLLTRLAFLQFGEEGRYDLLSRKNCIRFIPVLPRRGDILDRNGAVLAANTASYRLFIENPLKTRREEVLSLLQKELSLSEAATTKLRKESLKRAYLSLILVQDNLSWEQVSRLSLLQTHCSELHITMGYTRSYPYEEIFGSVTGYIGAPDAQEESSEPFHKHPDHRLGKAGLEKTFDETLQGAMGFRKVEVNATGSTVRQLEFSRAVQGSPLKTTLDAKLQAFAYHLLKPYKAAACVVIEVPSGAVRCLVSVPSYAPTALSNGESQAWKAALQDPMHPLLSRAIAGQYPPASVFKVVTMLAALENGLSPQEKVTCSGYWELGNHRFHCWKSVSGHGPLNLLEATCQSCDVYFFSLARRLGITPIASVARTLGLGEATGLLYGEKEGLVPSRAWKLLRRRQAWSLADTILVSIGQGPILVTPLQLAVLAAHIAHHGKRVHPTLVEAPLPLEEDLGFRPESIVYLQNALTEVCTTGTGRRARPAGALVAGKTGTAQVRRISEQDRVLGKLDTADRAWEERDHSLFLGYAPAGGDPSGTRYAISVVIEHGGKGGVTAATVARQLFEALLELPPQEQESYAPAL